MTASSSLAEVDVGRPEDGHEHGGLEFEEAILIGVVSLLAILRCWVSASIAGLLLCPCSTLSTQHTTQGACGGAFGFLKVRAHCLRVSCLWSLQ